jgi:hypothetical protein
MHRPHPSKKQNLHAHEKTLAINDDQRSLFPGTGMANHPSAQLKLSREHLSKRLTQKPLSRQANMLVPQEGG